MQVTWLILAMALGTFALRYVPLSILSRFTLPKLLRDWLALVPGAVIAALLAQAVLLHEGTLRLPWENPSLVAAVPCLLVAWRTRSVLATMATGIAAYALLSRYM